MKQLTAATYAHVWWPTTGEIAYPEGREPRWDPAVDNRTSDGLNEWRFDPTIAYKKLNYMQTLETGLRKYGR